MHAEIRFGKDTIQEIIKSEITKGDNEATNPIIFVNRQAQQLKQTMQLNFPENVTMRQRIQ